MFYFCIDILECANRTAKDASLHLQPLIFIGYSRFFSVSWLITKSFSVLVLNLFLFLWLFKHTNDPKDAQDVWGKDDQQVDECEQSDSYGDVAWPVEGLVGKHHLLDCSPYLFTIERIEIVIETMQLFLYVFEQRKSFRCDVTEEPMHLR